MAHKISLIVQPGDSFFPIVRAIDRAERSLNLTVFRLDDPIIQQALVEAKKRGVRIRVLIASSARGWEEKNRKLLKDAKKAGIATKEPAGDSKKTRYHYKIMTVDDAEGLVFTFNPTRENLHYTRDFGIQIYDPKVAGELNRLFDADWDDMPFTPEADSPLMISPFNSRSRMEELLDSATTSISIADAKVEDPAIVKLLADKAAKGVKVRVLGDEHSSTKYPKGIAFRAITRYKLHAKCVVVDDARASVGSMNLRTNSLDARREVCILVDDAEVVRRIVAVFESDWDQRMAPSASAATIVPGMLKKQDVVAREEPVAEGYVLISRTDALVRYPVRIGTTTFGRSEENDVVIRHPLASRHHASIVVDGDECKVVDHGSPNGTYLNGERIEGSHRLVPGDVLGIADAEEFRFFEV